MTTDCAFRRLIYASRAVKADDASDHDAILAVSRRNNGMDGISGILWSHDGRFLQLLEGPPESVGSAYERIARDRRHTDIEVLEDRCVDERLFADWSMAGMPGEHPRDAPERLRRLLRNADPEVTRLFA
jgi:hypothetical protein